MSETFLLECNEARYFSLDILSLCDMGCCMFGFFILPNRSCVFFTELCELYSSRMRSVKFDRGDVMRSRNGWPLKVTFQSSPPAVSRGITRCFAIQNIGEVSRSDGGVKFYNQKSYMLSSSTPLLRNYCFFGLSPIFCVAKHRGEV